MVNPLIASTYEWFDELQSKDDWIMIMEYFIFQFSNYKIDFLAWQNGGIIFYQIDPNLKN